MQKKISILIFILTVLSVSLQIHSFSVDINAYTSDSIKNYENYEFAPSVREVTLKGIFLKIKNGKNKEVGEFLNKNKEKPDKVNLTNNTSVIDLNNHSGPKTRNGGLFNLGVYEIKRTMTPLLYAINFGNDEIAILFILSKAVDVNMPDNERVTPLHEACLYKRQEVVKNLLEKFAEIKATDNLENTPLHSCFFDNAKKEETFEIAKLLINKGGKKIVNANNKNGVIPFHLACKNATIDTIKFLIKNGAWVNEPDNEGIKPIHYACLENCFSVVALLLETEAKESINEKIQKGPLKGKTPLLIALNRDYENYEEGLKIIMLLISCGADNHEQSVLITTKNKKLLKYFNQIKESGMKNFIENEQLKLKMEKLELFEKFKKEGLEIINKAEDLFKECKNKFSGEKPVFNFKDMLLGLIANSKTTDLEEKVKKIENLEKSFSEFSCKEQNLNPFTLE